MSNSSLINYTKISPNKTSPRNHVIDTITIHCVVGQCSVESLGDLFANPARNASSNYGIGSDGRIAMYVEEKDRSWCSDSPSNDNRAITIECASDTTHPYAINDAVYKSLIKLCADICKRNGIKELKWVDDKSLIGQVDKQNMTVHRWFENKSCPGDYIFERLGKIAAEVNELLGVKESKPTSKPVSSSKKSVDEIAKEVIAGKWGSGQIRKDKLTKAGYNYAVVQNRVNEMLSGNTTSKPVSKPTSTKPVSKPVSSSKKSVDEIAKEVIAGKWGSGQVRKNKLTKAGYNYAVVQKRVDKMLSGNKTSKPTPKKSVDEIAEEVIAGKWGSGQVRKNKLTKAGYNYAVVQKRVNELLS